MALPEGDIKPQIKHVKIGAETLAYAQFVDYISTTWINGATWKPSDWTVFKQAVCMNNNLEG